MNNLKSILVEALKDVYKHFGHEETKNYLNELLENQKTSFKIKGVIHTHKLECVNGNYRISNDVEKMADLFRKANAFAYRIKEQYPHEETSSYKHLIQYVLNRDCKLKIEGITDITSDGNLITKIIEENDNCTLSIFKYFHDTELCQIADTVLKRNDELFGGMFISYMSDNPFMDELQDHYYAQHTVILMRAKRGY